MVASVRDLVNIQLSTTTISPKHSIYLPILNIEKNIIIASVRGRILVGLKDDSSIISTTLSKPYCEHIEIQNHNTS